MGTTIGDIKGDTRSLDIGSTENGAELQPRLQRRGRGPAWQRSSAQSSGLQSTEATPKL